MAAMRMLSKRSNGEMRLEMYYVLPISTSVPFEVNTWTKYGFAFLWTLVEICCVAFPKVFVSGLFYSLCLHTIAIMRNLQIMSKQFDEFKFVICDYFQMRIEIKPKICYFFVCFAIGTRLKCGILMLC